jgi:hypothetical protein
MMSAKLAVLMAAMAVIGTAAGAIPMAPMALAQDQTAETEIERNNEIEQEIEQEQEACVNEAEAEVSDDDEVDIGGDNSATVEQSNECTVEQSQTAENAAAIDDSSTNEFSVEQILANVGLPSNSN